MPAISASIQPEITSWVLGQAREEQLGTKLMNNIKQWLDGTKTPAFNQIEDISRKANIPLGYFSCRHHQSNNYSLFNIGRLIVMNWRIQAGI